MEVDPQLRAQAHAAFRFVVEVDKKAQAAFTECTLPAIEFDVEEVKEGGQNSYTHQLPGRRKAAKISLKSGVGKCELLAWYLQNLRGPIIRKLVTVKLLDPKMNVVMSWQIGDAYPVKWSGPELRTDSNTIAIQTFELVGGEITVE